MNRTKIRDDSGTSLSDSNFKITIINVKAYKWEKVEHMNIEGISWKIYNINWAQCKCRDSKERILN